MADLDLLTLPQHAERAGKILETLGLRESHRTVKHRVFDARVSTRSRSFAEHADNDVRADREFALTTDPALAQGDWGGLLQRRRILRALRARTPRHWSLHNVRAALAEPHSGSGARSML
jgi:hypothetical protein